jgi:small-conductance mechanosensitive channel
MQSMVFRACQTTLLLFLSIFLIGTISAQDTLQKPKDTLIITKNDTTIPALVNKVQSYSILLRQNRMMVRRTMSLSPMSADLQDIEARLGRLKARVDKKGRSMNLLSLNSATILIGEMNDNLKDYQGTLMNYRDKLLQSNKDVVKILHDSTLNNRNLDAKLIEQLQEVRTTAFSVDSLEGITMGKINVMINRVSIDVLQANDLISDMNYLNFSVKRAMWGQEDAPLFSDAKEEHNQSYIDVAYNSLGRAGKIIQIYLAQKWEILTLGLLFLIFIMGWSFANLRKVRRMEDAQAILEPVHFMKRSVILGCTIGFLTFFPYFFSNPPIAFLHAMEFLRLILLCFLILPFLHGVNKILWIITSLVWVLFAMDDLMLEVADEERWFLFMGGLILSSICVLIIVDSKGVFKKIQESRITTALAIFTLALTVTSIVFDLTGRVTLAKIFAITAIQSLVTGITLKVFSATILESVYLQSEAYSSSRFSGLIDMEEMEQRFRRGLWIIASVIWTITFVRSLTMYTLLKRIIVGFFEQEHSVGNMNFTFQSVILFFLILWASSIIAAVINFFFGQENRQLTGKKSKIGSMMLLIKLTIWSIGFLLAVAATGIPLDRLSFMLGALGVGIGFGLQNIVNNLVSGVIIAFERPIQIGDLIEIGSRSGTVKEIGVRSSTLQSGEGSDIIVPNGDLLSQQLINWTMQNRNKRIDFPINIPYTANLETAKSLIQEKLKNNAGVLQTPEPKLMVQNFSEHTVDMKVIFWVADLSQANGVKSSLMTDIYDDFKNAGIPLDH